MNRLLPAALHIVVGGVVLAVICLIDPMMLSKAHGPLLVTLAFIFVIQDTLFWVCRRKLEDFLKSEGIPIDDIDNARAKVEAFKSHLTNLWLSSMIFRVAELISGVVLVNATLSDSYRIILGYGGYLAVIIGTIVALHTYAAYQHVDTAHTQRELDARERNAREKTAEEILAKNSSDWKKDPSLSGYGKPIKLKI